MIFEKLSETYRNKLDLRTYLVHDSSPQEKHILSSIIEDLTYKPLEKTKMRKLLVNPARFEAFQKSNTLPGVLFNTEPKTGLGFDIEQ